MKSMGKPRPPSKRKETLRTSTRLDPSKKSKGSTSLERPIHVGASSSSSDDDNVPLLHRFRRQSEGISLSSGSGRGVSTSSGVLKQGVASPVVVVETVEDSHVILTSSAPSGSIPVPPSSSQPSAPSGFTEEEERIWAEFAPSVLGRRPKTLARKRARVATPESNPPAVAPSRKVDHSVQKTASMVSPSKVSSSSPCKSSLKKSARMRVGVSTPSGLSKGSVSSSTPAEQSSSPAASLNPNVPPRSDLPKPFSPVFVTKAAADRQSFVQKLSFLCERKLDLPSYEAQSDILPFIASCSLDDSVSLVSGFSANVIREFYCNLSPGVFDPASSQFQRVFVRGTYFLLSPARFNGVLGIPFASFPVNELDFDEVISTITGGSISKWPNHKDFPSAALTQRYALLHKIALHNWMPSKHATGVKKSLAGLLFRIGKLEHINLGQLIFDSLATYSSTKVNSTSLIFPNFIYKLLVSQDASVGRNDPLFPVSLMKLSAKSLRKDGHRSTSSAPVSGVATPSIADLQATILALQRRIDELEGRVTRSEELLSALASQKDLQEGLSTSASSSQDQSL